MIWTRGKFSQTHSNVQAVLLDYIGKFPVFVSDRRRAPGVIVIKRFTPSKVGHVNWQDVAADIARKTNLRVLCVADDKWKFGDVDIDVTLFAFDVHELPDRYKSHPANKIEPVDPSSEPSKHAVSVKRLRKLLNIVEGRIRVINGAIRARNRSGLDASELEKLRRRMWEATYRMNIHTIDKFAEAVEKRDFDGFLTLAETDECSPRAVI